MSCKLAISSMSLGRAEHHALSVKLDEARKNGILGIEIFFEDLQTLARTSFPSNDQSSSLIQAAQSIRKLCDDRSLEIICLQPFMHYEGLKDRTRHAERVEEMKLWFQLAHALGTNTIQIPASFLPKEEITEELNVVVGDLREVVDLGAQEDPPLRFAFENLCWSTYFNTWEKVYDIVEKVDRPNFGICLDTFHIAGGVYGDPTSSTGRTPNAERDMRDSLVRMVNTIDVRKIVFVQVVDGEKMREPLIKGHAFHVDGQPPRMSWSRNARLFAFEESGYLPIMDVLKAIVQGLGYTGWLSMELFSRTMSNPAAEVPKEHARRAAEAWTKIKKEMEGWNTR